MQRDLFPYSLQKLFYIIVALLNLYFAYIQFLFYFLRSYIFHTSEQQLFLLWKLSNWSGLLGFFLDIYCLIQEKETI